jgi:hypothetical protein
VAEPWLCRRWRVAATSRLGFKIWGDSSLTVVEEVGGWTGGSDAASAARSGWGRRDGAAEDDMDERVDEALEDDEDIGARD